MMATRVARRGPTVPWPLFDEAWYLRRYPEVALAGCDAWEHYRERGEVAGHRPNPLFDTRWYTRKYADEIGSGRSPLAVFIERGGIDRPNALFDPGWYRDFHRLDRARHPCALSHYLTIGAAHDLAPHPLFDATWYRERYPEVHEGGYNPLAHYLEIGEAAGYWPNPWFDVDWVRRRSKPSDPDLPTAESRGLLEAYVDHGYRIGDPPHPLFDPVDYRSRHPEVERSGTEPLHHFLSRGQPAGHAPNPFADPDEPLRLSPCLERFRAILERARRATASMNHGNDVLFAYLDADPTSSSLDPTDESKLASEPADRAYAPLAPRVSIVIPSYNQPFHTLACVDSVLEARTRTSFEVLVSEDGSDPDLLLTEAFERHRNVRYRRRASNRGFLRNCNETAREARGEFLVFLNNDTLVTDDWLDELLATFDRFPDVGIAGSKLLFPNGRVSEAGGIVWRDATAWNFGRHRPADDLSVSYAREVDYVSGACLSIRKDLFEALGGFDEAFAPAYFEDTDLAFRVRRAGKRVFYQANSEVVHFEGTSSGIDLDRGVKRYQRINQLTFAQRWRDAVDTHAPHGENPEREKDRYAGRAALVIDACLPTPQRDTRSRRLVNMMKILRDQGFHVRFLAEQLHPDEPGVRELRGNGIEVLFARNADPVASLTNGHAAHFDVCLTARPAVTRRWLPAIEQCQPNARIITDATDLWHEGDAFELPNRNRSRIRALADFSASRGARATLGSTVHLPPIFEPPKTPLDARPRRGIWVVTGFQDSVAADALSWLRDEVIPQLCALARGDEDMAFHFRQRAWTDHLTRGCKELRALDEARLFDATALDSFRVAVAPVRFGAGLENQIHAVLSRGIPCVASPRAIEGMERPLSSAVVVAESAHEFARALLDFHLDEARWSAASLAAASDSASRFPYSEAVETVLSAAR